MKNNSAAWMRIVFISILLCSSFTASSAEPHSLDSARALFKQRCATAGENIKRRVSDVDGVFLLKLRSGELNYRQQFRFDDPYGSDYRNKWYIQSFLQAHHQLPDYLARMRGRSIEPSGQVGYEYVEAVDVKDGKRYRYTAFIEQPGIADPRYAKNYYRVVLESKLANGQPPRYGVTYEDISTTEDRNHWIAGSSLKVIDLHNNEVIAERIGYMMDLGQGADGGGRSPWLDAASNACPAFGGRIAAISQGGQTDRFVEKVLQPRPSSAPLTRK